MFPIAYSTLDSRALISRVLNEYEIADIQNCIFWHRGLSDIYLVETQACQYILRVSHAHWRTRADIDFELQLLNFLQSKAIPVAYPLPTREGSFSIEIDAPEGKRYAAVFVYAPGRVALGDLNVTQSYKLGETVAQLHQVAQHFQCEAQRQPLTLEYLLDDSFHSIAPFLTRRPGDLSYLTDTVKQIKSQLQHFSQEPPLWGICWGDAHSGNVHFTTDNQLMLFDFDQCGYGWRIFEIAKFLQVSLQSGLATKVREAFISGYQAIVALTDREVASLRAFTETAHIWAWSICLNQAMFHDYSRLDDHYFHHRIEHLKMLRSPDWQLF